METRHNKKISTIQIRPYQETDFERLAQIHDCARKNELALADLSAAFIPLSIAAVKEDLFSYDVYVAEYNDVVNGFIAFSKEEIAWLYVDINNTRKGIGKSLLSFALDKVKSNVSIEVLKGNLPAIFLYSSMGFKITETLSGKMPGNEHFLVTVHIMKR
ncbi:acetyltransferase [Staphylococcus sp. CAG:324]|jgi:acetyltransferase|nr:GNAT family N-acetyltransferase [Staphylococcus sp.]CDC69254.1 acetyltransferase [Staphylococcus sp. CAG:324]